MNVLRKRRLIRTAVTLAIALAASALALLATVLPGLAGTMRDGNEVPYDQIYHHRRPQHRDAIAPIAMVEVDGQSLKEMAARGLGKPDQRWPWPRNIWGYFVQYFEKQGAKCVVLDVHFTEPAVRGDDDDQDFAASLDAATIPVVIAGGDRQHDFAPPVKKPVILGDTEASGDEYRTYLPQTPRGPSLALAALRAAGFQPKLPLDQPFRILYHSPHRWGDNESAYPTYRASKVYESAGPSPIDPLPPSAFKDRIVVVGLTAAGLGDVKVSPWDDQYPGASVNATAIDNLIVGDQIRVAPEWLPPVAAFALSAAIAGFVIFIRSLAIKVPLILLCVGTLVAGCVIPVLAIHPFWLPPMVPVVAMILSLITALIYTYRIEDNRARVLLKALGQCVSPHVAAGLADDAHQLIVGGQRRETTTMFSDIAGFTALAERMGERIEPVLNFYLAEMSRAVLALDGTIDKYIGDAIMAFWNAPIAQADHAKRACRAALAIVAREQEIAPRLRELGAGPLRTRIGIHTGPNVVGFFGSQQRLSYTAIGDAVNLAARLEPSNKNYGSQILVSDATRAMAGDDFIFRRLDRLRVYGRQQPAEVFELMGDGSTVSYQARWLAAQFDAAMDRYFSQDWSGAMAVLAMIDQRCPGDSPTAQLRQRVEHYLQYPPGADWDGVHTASSK